MDTCIPLLQAKHQNATTRQGERAEKPSHHNTGRWVKKYLHRTAQQTGSEGDGDGDEEGERERQASKRAGGQQGPLLGVAGIVGGGAARLACGRAA